MTSWHTIYINGDDDGTNLTHQPRYLKNMPVDTRYLDRLCDLIAEEERRRRGEVTTPVMERCKFGL
jgi:hypothetical protein